MKEIPTKLPTKMPSNKPTNEPIANNNPTYHQQINQVIILQILHQVYRYHYQLIDSTNIYKLLFIVIYIMDVHHIHQILLN